MDRATRNSRARDASGTVSCTARPASVPTIESACGSLPATVRIRSRPALNRLLYMLRRLAAPCHHDQDGPDNDHGYRQQHTHGQPAPQKSELRIGFAEKLTRNTCKTIDRDETAQDQARPL